MPIFLQHGARRTHPKAPTGPAATCQVPAAANQRHTDFSCFVALAVTGIASLCRLSVSFGSTLVDVLVVAVAADADAVAVAFAAAVVVVDAMSRHVVNCHAIAVVFL